MSSGGMQPCARGEEALRRWRSTRATERSAGERRRRMRRDFTAGHGGAEENWREHGAGRNAGEQERDPSWEGALLAGHGASRGCDHGMRQALIA